MSRSFSLLPHTYYPNQISSRGTNPFVYVPTRSANQSGGTKNDVQDARPVLRRQDGSGEAVLRSDLFLVAEVNSTAPHLFSPNMALLLKANAGIEISPLSITGNWPRTFNEDKNRIVFESLESFLKGEYSKIAVKEKGIAQKDGRWFLNLKAKLYAPECFTQSWRVYCLADDNSKVRNDLLQSALQTLNEIF